MGLTRIRAEQISNIDYKQAVRVVTTSDVTLASGAPSAVDGVNLATGNRILVSGQTNKAENGIYVVQTLGAGENGTWIRATDANQTGEIEPGMVVMVTEGVLYADTPWKLITNGVITIGVTELTFQQFTANVTPGGSNTQIQYNSDNVFAGSANLTWDGSELYVNGAANVTGNVSAEYFLGNGALLTGVITSVSNINNGTSNVSIPDTDGNVTISVDGVSNIAVFSTDGLIVTGNITGNGIAVTTVSNIAPANAEQGDIWINSDNGKQFIYFSSGGNSQWAEMEAYQSFSSTGGGGDYGNANVATYLPTYGGNIGDGSGYVFGNGAFLTGVTGSGSYGDANVATYLNTGLAGNVIPAANVTYDLGSASNRWNDIWLANSTIHLGSANISEIGGNLVLPANTTIGGTLAQTPRISNVQIATSGWVVKDDTAVDLAGGYIIINGSGFVTGASVLVNTTAASSATVVNSTQIRAQVGAQAAGTYVVYVVNPDGSVAILINGLTYSGTPTWVTGSTLPQSVTNTAFSIQLTATGATTYSLSAGNTLPPNTTLSSGGLLAGNISVETETVYSFSVDATDTEAQESPRAFSLTVTIVIADPYFNQVSMLLPGTGANNATNNTFLDSSTNNFAITRNGNTTQGSFSPYSPAGWSNYFDGTGDYLSCSASAVSGLSSGTSGDYTVEAWVYLTALPSGTTFSTCATIVSGSGASNSIWQLWGITSSGYISMDRAGNGYLNLTATTPALNTWNHIAFVNSGTTITVYLNGTSVGTMSSTGTWYVSTTSTNIGGNGTGSGYLTGYISNLRLVSSAVYTGNFTPPVAPLTAIANTSLLTCQSNRFVDNSTNAFAITRNGDVKVTNSAPFAPTVPWSAATHGGSAYFDGSGDWLSLPTSSAFALTSTTAWTVECWVYLLTLSTYTEIMTIGIYNQAVNVRCAIGLDGKLNYWSGSNSWAYTAESNSSNAVALNSWNHCVWTRSGNTLQMYINGVQGYNATFNFGSGNSGNAYIASYFGSNQNMLTGYISNFRCVLGTSVYTSNFTPPTAPVTAIANTSLLLNTTNAGITDAATRNVVETVGDAKISTVQSKWGGGSMSFDGTGDYAVQPTNINYGYSTGNFTIEFWLRLNVTTDQTIVSNLSTASSVNPHLYYSNGTGIRYYTNNADRITGSALSTGQWYHIALCRSSGSTRLFINGTQSGSTYTDSNDYGSSAPLGIGTYWSAGAPLSTNTLNGYINDLRVTKGIARYTANFTPPAQAFPLQ